MRNAGILLTTIGVIGLAFACFYSPTVETGGMFGGEVNNLGLMQNRIIGVSMSLIAIICGTLCIVGAEIVDAIQANAADTAEELLAANQRARASSTRAGQ